MKCVCRTKCQTRLSSGKIKFFTPGMVEEFSKCPTHFEPIEEIEEVNFQTASKEELMAAKWKKEDAVAFIHEKGAEPIIEDQIKKSDLVDMILDARFREVD